ncbi:MAG: hypothetical protein COA63_014170 [Methylophaga sp.]|nr:hypothetical protein [Methylophaga sp.]
MDRIFTSFGTPILSPDKKSIWAFWAAARDDASQRIEFMSVSQLLDAPSHDDGDSRHGIKLYVYYSNDCWIASDNCVQKDFSENNMFIPALLTGIESLDQAIDIIINSPEARSYFEGSNLLERLGDLRSYERNNVIGKPRKKYVGSSHNRPHYAISTNLP